MSAALVIICRLMNANCNILQAPTIAAAAYLRLAGRPPVIPSSNLSYSENFLYMLDSLYVIWSSLFLSISDNRFIAVKC
jgi:hypothetical protein